MFPFQVQTKKMVADTFIFLPSRNEECPRFRLPIDAAQRKVVLLELWNGGWKTDSHEETCKRLGEVF